MTMKLTHAVKRKLVQIVAFGLTNSHVSNFASGQIYTGPWKKFCNPGLNCYSCPAAGLACPIGAMQAVSGSTEFGFSFYVVGIVLALGVVLGRFICGFLCPFGLFQELIYKIPGPPKHLKLKKWMTYCKYGFLVIFVLILPLVLTNYMGIGKPAFCEYICPAGTLEGGIPLLLTNASLSSIIGSLFFMKLAILIAVIVACLFFYRFFCKTMCPLGAIYGLLNKISLYRMEVDKKTCVSCGKCATVCKMDVDPSKTPNSAECIRCGDCTKACPVGALHLGFARKNETGQEPEKA